MIEIQLSRFQGPLDLLLFLISKARIDIKDIFVSEITEQYLSSVQDVGTLDMDTASEFIQMAATLLEIKSRALLPRPPRLEEGEEDPREVLLRRLEEYKKVKEDVERLRALEPEGLARLYRLPAELTQTARVELSQMTLEALEAAFLRLTQRPGVLAPERLVSRQMERDRYPIARCVSDILLALDRVKWLRFSALFEDGATRDRLVSTFIALLELLKAGRVTVRQETQYEEIWLSRATAVSDPVNEVEIEA